MVPDQSVIPIRYRSRDTSTNPKNLADMEPDALPADPTSVVQRQLDAYNAHDIGALLATYAEDARHFQHPAALQHTATLMATGHAELRARFAARFAEPGVHATLLHRTMVGDFVVDRERVARTFPEGRGHIDLLCMYEVRDGKIVDAWFWAGPEQLDA